MTNKEKIIIQFDPDEHYFVVTDLILGSWGMELQGKAKDSHSSLMLVERIEKKELKPDVAIIEAYMGKSEEDGMKIAKRLRELNPEIVIIGFSTFETESWADIEAIKGLKDSTKRITDVLSGVTGNQYSISNAGEQNRDKFVENRQ